MSDSLKGNLWAERNLPALEYCNIRRAADLLSCTVSDILHWAEIEAINLCLRIDWMPSTIDFNIGMEQAEPWFEQQINSKATLNPRAVLSKKSCFYLGVDTVNPLEADIKYNINGQEIGFNIKKNEKGQICGHAEGFWNFFVFGYNEMVYHELNSCGSITFDFLDLRIVAADRADEPEIYLTPCSFVEDDLFYCDSEDKSGFEKIKLPSLLTITLEDLFITRNQLEYLYSRRGEVLASLVTGDIQRNHRDGNINKAETKRRAPKKDALMTALMNRIGVDSERPLKSLLELVGMNEQKLKSYSESQLHRALSKELEANMPDIDPKTLARWLKDEGAR